MKLGVLLSHPTQYYSPWFQWIAANTSIHVRVFYLWDFGVAERRDPQFQTVFKWDINLLSGYEHEFIPNVASRPGTDQFAGLDNPLVGSRLSTWGPDALLMFGYNSQSHLRALAWARLHHVPLLFRGDSHFLGRGSPAWHRRLLLGLLYAQFAAFLPVGHANHDYFRRLGVPERKLFFAPHAVNDRLFDPSILANREHADALRRNLGIPASSLVVLFAGKLVSHKAPRALLEAFLRGKVSDAHLVFVGEGPEKEALVHAGEAASSRVHFLAFANQTEMPARYLMADLFVLPSRSHYETWGLAVNEAMHMGVPALVSDLVGCHGDLVQPDETGWVFPAYDDNVLRSKLEHALTLLTDAKARDRFRHAVRARVAGYSYAAATAGLHRALDFVSGPGGHTSMPRSA
jgi:glycosyltransferase involved in cell wall biosynthesis